MPNLTGQSIGRYHILEQLGEGGMATVYKAYDTRLERNVAFKVLRTDLFGQAVLEQVLKRFEREAKSLAKLSHPNIVNILDYGEHEEMPYLVMEYLPGGTLKQKMGQKVPWQESIQILIPVARGLAYAHEHNVIHRDVKPANILIKEGNQPVLTDFGIAKLLEGAEGHTLTASGVGIGTPEYMAPEQGIGASTIDARADIYSLGIMFYEMVTGRKPYIADTPMAVVLKQMTDPLPRPTDFVPDLPENVEHILLKALAKEPSDRYADMNVMIAAMEDVLTDVKKVDTIAETKKVEAKTPVYPLPKKREKKKAAPHAKPSPKVVMATVGAIIVVLVVVFGASWAKHKFSSAPLTKATLTKASAAPPTSTRTVLPPSPVPELTSTHPATLTDTPDPAIQTAFDFIQSNKPLYERTFEFSWDKKFYAEDIATKTEDGKLFIVEDNATKVENGKLVVTYQPNQDQSRGDITPPQGTFGPDRFAVEFEFRIADSSQDQGRCYFNYWGKNGGEVWGLNLGFSLDGQAELWNTEFGQLALYNYDASTSNMVTIISLGDRIAGFMNGQLVYTAFNIRRNAVYDQQFFQSDNFAICEFDNYKFWDLSELDVSVSAETTVENPAGISNFPEPILTYISNNPPTFDDDFSTTKSGWGSNSEGMAIFDSIKNGYLNIRDGIDPNHNGPFSPDFKVPGVAFPTNGLFDASDFALQFWFQFGDTKSINLQLRSAETIDTGYRFTLEQSGHWELESSEDVTLLAEGNQAISTEYNKALVIANDNNLAIFINDKPIYVSDGVSTSRTNNRIIVIGNIDGARCNFDDFKFWNLDGVEVSNTPTTPTVSTSTSEWVTDFAEPILSTISGQAPDYQDDFSTNSGGWTNGDTIADWRLEFVDGELIVTSSPFERNMWYTDFVIEMDARFLSGDSSSSNKEWRFHYRQPGVNYFFDFEYNSDVEVGYEQLNTPSEYIRLENVLGSVTSNNHILIIVKDQAVALFVNDEPIFYDTLKPIWKTGGMEWSVDGKVAFDNFKIWDIRELETP